MTYMYVRQSALSTDVYCIQMTHVYVRQYATPSNASQKLGKPNFLDKLPTVCNTLPSF